MKNRKLFAPVLAAVAAGAMTLSLVFSILPTRANAVSSSEIKKQIASLQEDRKDIKNQISDLKEQYQANTDEIADMVARKNVIDQEIGLLHTEIININEQITAYGVLIADKQDELDQAESRLQKLSDDYKVRIRAMEEEGTLSYWEVLFKANSFSDLLDRLNMVEEIAASDNRRLKELSEAANHVAEAQEALEGEKADLELTKNELGMTQQELDDKRAEADDLIKELLKKGEEIEGLQEQLEQEDQDLLAEIARKEKEYNEAKNQEWLAYMATYTTAPPPTVAPTVGISSSDGNNSTTNNQSGGDSGSTGAAAPSVNIGSSWMVPCSYKMVSSPFGLRNSPTAGASTYHQGVDLAANAGTPIYASRGGTVTSATFSNSAGYYVTINHGDGFSSIYMHMTNYVVSAGQSVSQGQVIGYVGSTGISTGNHLHFGIAFNGAYQNPCSYVGLY